MGLENVDELVEIVGQTPYCTLTCLAKPLNCLNITIMGPLKEFGYKSLWLTWIYSNLSPNLDGERLQIVKLLFDR